MELWSTRVACCLFFFSLLVSRRFGYCASLNEEGRALLIFRESIEDDPSGSLSNWRGGGGGAEAFGHCSWFGVECSDDGRVVALILKGLGLKGILSSELRWLVHIQILDLSNNSFHGPIPGELGNLPKLDVLDLSQNNLSGDISSDLEKIVPIKQLFRKGNKLSSEMPNGLQGRIMVSEVVADGGILSCRKYLTKRVESATFRQLLEARGQQETTPAMGKPHLDQQGRYHLKSLPPSQSPPIAAEPGSESSSYVPTWATCTLSISGALSLMAVAAALYRFFRHRRKDNTVMPWATGLSGQLSKAFVTGVPSLERAELETSTEDFSNVIGTSSGCALYKGTLSSGVEIAVLSTSVKSAEEWSDQAEEQFRNKISVLSKVNHKNFMNLLGYCTCDDEPFTRMMVFEYAPCGTLFEHLHIREAEHLDWPTRLRIIMGVAYCLEHMNQLDPPLNPATLSSSAIYLTEDYAAKISDMEFSFSKDDGGEEGAARTQNGSSQESAAVVYRFGILLLEVISGRLPFSEDHGLLALWASSYLDGKRPLRGMVDPTLKASSVPGQDVAALCDVVRRCIERRTERRPGVAEVARLVRGITGLSSEKAAPRDNQLWWAELEIASSEAG